MGQTLGKTSEDKWEVSLGLAPVTLPPPQPASVNISMSCPEEDLNPTCPKDHAMCR